MVALIRDISVCTPNTLRGEAGFGCYPCNRPLTAAMPGLSHGSYVQQSSIRCHTRTLHPRSHTIGSIGRGGSRLFAF